MGVEQVAERYKDEAFLRKVDKIGYRYPRGESYFDIISRLDPLVSQRTLALTRVHTRAHAQPPCTLSGDTAAS